MLDLTNISILMCDFKRIRNQNKKKKIVKSINKAIDEIKDKEWNLIHIGMYDNRMWQTPNFKSPTGYNNRNFYNNDKYIEDITKNTDFSELCITSYATIKIGDTEEIKALTTKADGNKCPVCWKVNKDKCTRHGV